MRQAADDSYLQSRKRRSTNACPRWPIEQITHCSSRGYSDAQTYLTSRRGSRVGTMPSG